MSVQSQTRELGSKYTLSFKKKLCLPFSFINFFTLHCIGGCRQIFPPNLSMWEFPHSISFIDPRGQPTVTANSDHYFHTSTFQKLAKQNNFQVRIVIASGRDCGSGRGDHWWHMSCFLYYYYIELHHTAR